MAMLHSMDLVKGKQPLLHGLTTDRADRQIGHKRLSKH